MKKGIQIGMIWAVAFLLLFPIGNAMAADVSTDNDTTTTIRCHVQTGLPVINEVKFMDNTWTLRNNTQIDVLQTYYFEINVTQDAGWSGISYVNVTLWFDFGADPNYPSAPTTTNNTQFRLVYDNTTGTPSFGLAAPGNGEVTFINGHLSAVNSTTTIVNFSFTPQNEIRHATGVGTAGTGFNDLNSWNYRVNATNNNSQSDTWDDEFGVFLYTTVSAVNDPEGTGTPGTVNLALNTNGNTVVTYTANEQFNLSVGINDLSSGANTITADNVRVQGGDIGTYTAFASGGSSQWIYGGAGTGHAAYDTYTPGTDHTVNTLWQMDIPFGTPTGTYTSPVTYTIQAG